MQFSNKKCKVVPYFCCQIFLCTRDGSCCTRVMPYCIRVVSCCTRAVSCCVAFYSYCLVFSRVVLVLCRVIQCYPCSFLDQILWETCTNKVINFTVLIFSVDMHMHFQKVSLNSDALHFLRSLVRFTSIGICTVAVVKGTSADI